MLLPTAEYMIQADKCTMIIHFPNQYRSYIVMPVMTAHPIPTVLLIAKDKLLYNLLL